jgi:hypothetical protein
MNAGMIQEQCGKCLRVEVSSDPKAVEEKVQNTFKSKNLITEATTVVSWFKTLCSFADNIQSFLDELSAFMFISALEMEAVISSESLVSIYKNTLSKPTNDIS